MKAATIAAILVAAAPALACAATTVEDTLDDYIRRTNSHDFDQVVPLLADDAVYWFRDSDSRGQEQIRAAFDATWRIVKDEYYSVYDVRWLAIDDDAAAVIYEYRWRGLIGGKPRNGGGRGTNVFRRIGGEWKIVHEHLSPYVEAKQ